MENHKGLNACECNDMGEKDYSLTYMWYNYIVVMLILPFVAAFGVISNIINCYIFTRPSMHSSVSIYLLALSCSDFLVVSTGAFVFYSDSVRVYFASFTETATQGIIWVLPLGYIAQTCSVYFTVAAAADCYFKVCWHPLSQNWCTIFRAKLATVAVTIFSISYNALRFWQFALNPCFDELHNSSNIEVCPTELYYEIGVIYNVYMYMVLMTALPFMLLSILNMLIVRTVRNTSKNTSKLKDPSTGEISIDKDLVSTDNVVSDDSVITMIMVVILFLACNTLALVVNIVETFFDPHPLLVQYMTDTSNLLVVFNSSVNYVIYMLFDSVYRAEFKKCIFCKSRPPLVRTISQFDENSKRNGSMVKNYVTFDMESEMDKKQTIALGKYTPLPTSPSTAGNTPKRKCISRFISLDEDKIGSDSASIPLMSSSDDFHKIMKDAKAKNAWKGSLTMTY